MLGQDLAVTAFGGGFPMKPKLQSHSHIEAHSKAKRGVPTTYSHVFVKNMSCVFVKRKKIFWH